MYSMNAAEAQARSRKEGHDAEREEEALEPLGSQLGAAHRKSIVSRLGAVLLTEIVELSGRHP